MILAAFLFALQDDSALFQAVEKLQSGTPAERRAAEETIRKAGARAVPVLCRVLEDDHAGLRDKVATWVSRLSSKEWKVRDEAMKALVRLGRYAVPFLEEHEGAGDPEVAWRVKSVIAELQDRAGQEEAVERTRDAGLFRLLGELGDPAAVPTLLHGLSDSGPEVRMAATEGLARLEGKLTPEHAEEATERVLELYRGHRRSDERCLLLRALGAFGTAACVKPIVQLLRDNSETNVVLKQNALAVLAGTKDAEAWKAIVEMTAGDAAYVRYAAFRHLATRAGDRFGYDPRLGPEENREAIARARVWWEREFGQEWDESGPATPEERHRRGLRKCEEGVRLLRVAEPRIERRGSLSEREISDLCDELERAGRLLEEGMGDVEKSGIREDVALYVNAKASVRRWLKDLGR